MTEATLAQLDRLYWAAQHLVTVMADFQDKDVTFAKVDAMLIEKMPAEMLDSAYKYMYALAVGKMSSTATAKEAK